MYTKTYYHVPGTRVATFLFLLLFVYQLCVAIVNSTMEQEIYATVFYFFLTVGFYYTKFIVSKMYNVPEHMISLGDY